MYAGKGSLSFWNPSGTFRDSNGNYGQRSIGSFQNLSPNNQAADLMNGGHMQNGIYINDNKGPLANQSAQKVGLQQAQKLGNGMNLGALAKSGYYLNASPMDTGVRPGMGPQMNAVQAARMQGQGFMPGGMPGPGVPRGLGGSMVGLPQDAPQNLPQRLNPVNVGQPDPNGHQNWVNAQNAMPKPAGYVSSAQNDQNNTNAYWDSVKQNNPGGYLPSEQRPQPVGGPAGPTGPQSNYDSMRQQQLQNFGPGGKPMGA